MRRSYGFRAFRILELALYHSLGKLPEPQLSYEFFWGLMDTSGILESDIVSRSTTRYEVVKQNWRC